jgi:uncharacterized delta-60 repeat protein
MLKMRTALLCLITLVWIDSMAQPGALDPAFGQGGKVVTDIDHVRNVGSKILIQPDGKILVIGFCAFDNIGRDFTLVRYLPDGSLDNTFGLNGIVKTPISSVEDWALSAALQTDGKIIVAGYTWNGNNFDFALVRYHSDGMRDPTFGNGGIVMTDFAGNNDKAYGVCIQADGKIVLAGSSGDTGDVDVDVAIARYNPSGVLDESFGIAGKMKVHVGDALFWQAAKAIAVQPDGKILATGFTEAYDKEGKYVQVCFLTLRINSDGNLDNTFGDHGIAITKIGIDDSATSICIQPDGKILVLGSTNEAVFDNSDMAVVRYQSDGTADNAFGLNGIVKISTENNEDYGRALALQQNGQILAVGSTGPGDGSDWDFMIVRINPNGSLDGEFGAGGKVITDFTGDHDIAASVAVQADGKILIGGHSKIGADYDLLLARYRDDSTLPVKLISFTAEKAEQHVLLTWQTEGEWNSDLFEIQRSSNCRDWATVGSLGAANSSETVVNYEFVDTDPISGAVYYRLKMIDQDQSYAFSQIQFVRLDKLAEEPLLMIYPNPASEKLAITMPENMETFQKLELVNAAGNIIFSAEGSLKELDVSSLSQGEYVLRLTYTGRSFVKRFFISH